MLVVWYIALQYFIRIYLTGYARQLSRSDASRGQLNVTSGTRGPWLCVVDNNVKHPMVWDWCSIQFACYDLPFTNIYLSSVVQACCVSTGNIFVSIHDIYGYYMNTVVDSYLINQHYGYHKNVCLLINKYLAVKMQLECDINSYWCHMHICMICIFYYNMKTGCCMGSQPWYICCLLIFVGAYNTLWLICWCIFWWLRWLQCLPTY